VFLLGCIAVLRTYIQPIVTDRVAWCVGLSVTEVSPAKNGCADRDAIWVEDSGWPKEPHIVWGSRSPVGWGSFEGEGAAHFKV